MARSDPAAAALALRRDPAFRHIVRQVGPPPKRRVLPVAERYSYLVRSITYQQLAGAAAGAIHGRLVAACDDQVCPTAIDGLRDKELAACGLSKAKTTAIRDLTRHVDMGVVRFDRHGRQSDDEVIAELIQVKGVGVWTAQMYLLFGLDRPDVWPIGDLGVRNGWSMLHGLEAMVTPKDMDVAGARFAPYRSAVAYYCWEAVHLSRAKAE